MKHTFGNIILAGFAIVFVFILLAKVAACLDNYGSCPL